MCVGVCGGGGGERERGGGGSEGELWSLSVLIRSQREEWHEVNTWGEGTWGHRTTE